MELIEAIKKRRSVRNYSEKPLDWDTIADILDAARYAPSSGNVQDWRFIVIIKQDKIKQVAELCSQDWIEKSKAVVVVCSDTSKVKRLYSERGENIYSVQNTAAAIENMLLRACDLGVGSCWVGDFDEKELIEILKIKPNARPYAIITLGYPKEKLKAEDKDELENLVFFEEYGKRKSEHVGFMPIEKSIKNSLKRAEELLKYSKEKVKEK